MQAQPVVKDEQINDFVALFEQERAGMLIPWLVIGYISVVLYVAGIIAYFVFGQISQAFGTMARLAVGVLFLNAVQRRYKEIKANGSSARGNPVV